MKKLGIKENLKSVQSPFKKLNFGNGSQKVPKVHVKVF